jgi:hypothetical protein
MNMIDLSFRLCRFLQAADEVIHIFLNSSPDGTNQSARPQKMAKPKKEGLAFWSFGV